MKLNVRHHGDVSVVELSGQLTIGEDAQLRCAVQILLSEGRNRIVVNLKGVPWIDSAGMGELVACHKRVHDAGGSLNLCHLSSRAKRLLESTTLDRALEIHEDECQALAAF
jgi:anti-sigma B factor antagonist